MNALRSTPAAPALPIQSRFKHVALVGKYHAVGSRAALERLADFLHDMGCEVAIERETALNTGLNHYRTLSASDIGAECDLALVMGGDGTMLGIGRKLARYGVPVVGINQGRLGFITDIPFADFETHLRPILRGEYQEDQRALIHASVWRDGDCVFDTVAINDVVVNRGSAPSMIELRVEVDGRLVANQRADGLIIATSTGSTAYALSAGGPLLHPGIGGWVMVPIAPHTLSNRPVVLPYTCEIAVEIVSGRDASANFDMQSLTSLLHGDRIVVRRSEHTLRLLHPVGWSYFDTLRKKLHWNEGVGTP